MTTSTRTSRSRSRSPRFGAFTFLSRPAHVWTEALARPAARTSRRDSAR